MEFHLTQTYHEGLLKLQAKDYVKARELLESVLKDPLIANAQVESNASDGHLLQLRFLALKNLATVFLQQGSDHYERALQCYLQAVEIDSKDSVVWNQLGTLSCSMGLLSISRWAFEQGLLCSPNNWNCMEKLLEVLIAIGDEVACLSVAELILRHWPSHSRALHVKNTIEESDPAPFAPRGIDRLEPKHVKLKFLDKRKYADEKLNEGGVCKKPRQEIDLCLPEVSWVALVDSLLEILHPLNGFASETGSDKPYRSGDIRLNILLPSAMGVVTGSMEKKERSPMPAANSISTGDCTPERTSVAKEGNVFEEHPHERRSTRLERLRSRKPEKEEFDYAASKDLAKLVLQFVEPFIVERPGNKDFDHAASCSVSCPDEANVNRERNDVPAFVLETSKNYGAYHLAHLLLEWAASKGLVYQDAFIKFLELEKLTRHWGQDRSPECSLFLAELYYELGSLPSNDSKLAEFMSEASYHLCKIIESVALNHPSHSSLESENTSCISLGGFQDNNGTPVEASMSRDSFLNSSILTNKSSFWIRYFWLSGKLSILDRNKKKAHEELCISLSLLVKNEKMNDCPCSILLPHLKINKELTVDRVLHEINLLKVDFLLESTVGEMIEKEMHVECINLLAPLVLWSGCAHRDVLPLASSDQKGEGSAFIELSALDILIKACEKAKPMDTDVYLKCHQQKLEILMRLAGMDEYKHFPQKSCSNVLYACNLVSQQNPDKHWNSLVVEEVKAILQCLSQIKNVMDTSVNMLFDAYLYLYCYNVHNNGISDMVCLQNDIIVPVGTISDIQTLLLGVMCHIAINYLCKKSSVPLVTDEIEQRQRGCFIDAGIAFCKLQHLLLSIPVKIQVELIVAIHELLAEYGICCASDCGEKEEGEFLKFAIKHLFALDMKLKSNSNSSKKERAEHDEQLSPHSPNKASKDFSKPDTSGMEMVETKIKGSSLENVALGGTTSNCTSLCIDLEKEDASEECGKQEGGEGKNKGEMTPMHSVENKDELSEDEREELECLIENAMDQCFFCLYGLNLRADSSYDDDLAQHKNTSRGDYQTKEQCADVFQYILPYAKASSRTGLVKLRRVLRTIRKHFPQPPEDVLADNPIDKFLDNPDLFEDQLSEEAGSEGFRETMTNAIFPDSGNVKQYRSLVAVRSQPYLELYSNLYYFLALSEEMNATDKWPGFEVDLLLNDGSKHINVAGWRKNDTLPQRVETSRRRSRRCLLMSLALAKTSAEQGEIHELLALVYYDGIQNVVPYFDQRCAVPSKDAAWVVFCENSLKHFKKASSHKQDWSYAFYMGKLCEKLGYSYESSLAYYHKAISLNPTAVDPFYRMHASRLKLLCKFGKQNLEVLKDLSGYSFSQPTKDAALNILGNLGHDALDQLDGIEDRSTQGNSGRKHEVLIQMEGVWHMLYNDCLSALENCVEGDLKHFHKARYMLAQGLYRRNLSGDLERSKDELSFCFKSSRSSFTINMWEIDGMVKKGRRKTPGFAGNKKVLEVNLSESSRKFITCIHLVPVALGRLIKALISSMHRAENVGCGTAGSSELQQEKIFSLFMEQGNLWPEIFSLPEFKSPEISESNLYGYLHKYIASLETNCKLETIEAINEKMRKRFKNPKLSNSTCAKVCRHASVAWCRCLVISLASITPVQAKLPSEVAVLKHSDSIQESNDLLCVDLHANEFWSSSSEESAQLENSETKWRSMLANIENVIVRKISDENLEIANSLLRSCYNFYRESSCVILPSGVNLYLVSSRLAIETKIQPGLPGVETLDLSIPRKLLLWAYTLLHGRYTSISVVVKHCEENLKSRVKRGAGTPSVPLSINTPTATSFHTGGKDCASQGSGAGSEPENASVSVPVSVAAPASSLGENVNCTNPSLPSGEGQTNSSAAQPPLFGQLQAADLSSVEPAIRADTEGDNLRDDIPQTFEKSEAIVAGVPSYEEPYIKVPKVLNTE
ncbi:hypothetical protein Tsubulata_018120 [Turnera subulata]|uniref:Calcineurin-binding protein cabin-1 MEF2-binding domain-containing protein n=1 Tax=Turnera subulata TaxID=218843 RepID=A0A9Q0JF61_9ROSI|nr:hypothetical protein Tsubulata_018120 [Turnera subulata]